MSTYISIYIYMKTRLSATCLRFQVGASLASIYLSIYLYICICISIHIYVYIYIYIYKDPCHASLLLGGSFPRPQHRRRPFHGQEIGGSRGQAISIYLSIYLSIYRSIHLSIYLSIYLSMSSRLALHSGAASPAPPPLTRNRRIQRTGSCLAPPPTSSSRPPSLALSLSRSRAVRESTSTTQRCRWPKNGICLFYSNETQKGGSSR